MKKSLSLKGAAITVGLALLAMGLYRMDALGIRSKVIEPMFPLK